MSLSDRPAIDRRIVGFHRDEVGDPVADLECGHSQHVRHDPPWQVRPWVVTAAGREGRIGTVLPCAACAGGEASAAPGPSDAPPRPSDAAP